MNTKFILCSLLILGFICTVSASRLQDKKLKDAQIMWDRRIAVAEKHVAEAIERGNQKDIEAKQQKLQQEIEKRDSALNRLRISKEVDNNRVKDPNNPFANTEARVKNLKEGLEKLKQTAEGMRELRNPTVGQQRPNVPVDDQP